MCTCEYSQEGRLSRPLTKAPNYLVSDCFPRHSGSFTILQHSADPRRFYKPVLPLPIVPLTCSPDLNCRTYTTTCMHCFPGRVGLKMYSVVSSGVTVSDPLRLSPHQLSSPCPSVQHNLPDLRILCVFAWVALGSTPYRSSSVFLDPGLLQYIHTCSHILKFFRLAAYIHSWITFPWFSVRYEEEN